jgi:uncharacterized protein YdaU (DUF1376 family)
MISNKVDIWMPLYIGDYLADTGHLDAERSGCYLHWIMHYWRTGPLPNDIETLVLIGKLRSSNAPSIAQALLADFFALEDDERWHQKRIDMERDRWAAKSRKSKEKAITAANARWNRNAPSNAQAMPGQCPSSSSLPTKNIASSKQRPTPDSRASGFRQVFSDWFQQTNGVPAPWDGKEASNLSRFLRANPTITVDQWRDILRNRTRSPVNKKANLSRWIALSLAWIDGPADDWGKPTVQIVSPPSASGPKAKSQYQVDIERQRAARREAIEDRRIASELDSNGIVARHIPCSAGL